MEAFQLPLREVDARFTKSEIVIFAWRSQEIHWQFKMRSKEYEGEEETRFDKAPVVVEDEDGEKLYDVDAIYAALDKQFAPKAEPKQKKKPDKVIEKIVPGSNRRRRRKVYSGVVPDGLPDRFYNEEGEIDLRRVTGEDAFKYFATIGMPLPRFERFNR